MSSGDKIAARSYNLEEVKKYKKMENKEKQVRKIAQRVMTKYKLHPPVDMMGLIQEKGITCVEENLGTNADGYSDLKDSDLKIVLNSAIQYEPRKRFTLAHELGHIFISWHSDVTLCVTDNEYSEHNKLDIQEHEANVFASEILMPTEWVKEMLILNENRSLEYNIKQLCTIANTSIMACFYALENVMKSGNVIVVSGDMFFLRNLYLIEEWPYTFKDMMNMMFGMICVFVKKSLILEIIKYVIMSFQNVHQWNKLKLHLVQRKM